MKNLVGRKIIALQNYPTLGLTKGKEYEIINQEKDEFYFITDLGRIEFTSLIDSNFFRLVNESKFKQGDKVLVSNDKQKWHERVFVVEHNNLYQCEPLHENISNTLTPWQYIKPCEEEIKVGDWVVSELNDCVFKYQFGRVKGDLTKITDEVLINKLNEL